MLQYLIILLDGQSTSFCHHDVPAGDNKLIKPDMLRRAIRFAMIENLTIQFVYPATDLPEEHKHLIESIDHSKIMPATSPLAAEADVIVLNKWEQVVADWLNKEVAYVMRTPLSALLEHEETLVKALATGVRFNVVLTDVETMRDAGLERYKAFLEVVADRMVDAYKRGVSPQTNLLTDRLVLTEMNNCGSGDASLTLAPDGKFYVCPAFYNDGSEAVGDLDKGVSIPNAQLYKLKCAPICRECEAWQCKRCVWLNRHLTLEVNTPGRQQCVMAHHERNASRQLLMAVRQHGSFLPETDIPEIDYIDPFDNIKK
ncbi:MAG: CXXX repeat peptide maturase [Muribaculaceae bacterium]|nr:CXXX repeat peptide maturase [Muribaculaceae bacterium]